VSSVLDPSLELVSSLLPELSFGIGAIVSFHYWCLGELCVAIVVGCWWEFVSLSSTSFRCRFLYVGNDSLTPSFVAGASFHDNVG